MYRERRQMVGAHPDSFRRGHTIDAAACRRILLDVKEIFDAGGVRFWLMFGTFLGLYRDGDLIEGNGDIDLAIFPEDVKAIVSCEGLLAEKGFEMMVDSNDVVLYRDGEHVDLYKFHKRDSNRVYHTRCDYAIDAADFEKPNFIDFLGKKFRILSNPEVWIEYIYGPNWRVPDKSFRATFRTFPKGKKTAD